MSALPPEADMLIVGINVCYVPIADIGVRELGRTGAPLGELENRVASSQPFNRIRRLPDRRFLSWTRLEATLFVMETHLDIGLVTNY